MDNFKVDIVSEGKANLLTALNLFRFDHVVGYRIDESPNRIVFYWLKSACAVMFPFQMPMSQACDFISNWLEQADYGEYPDIDGDVKPGWRIYTDRWGQVESNHRTLFAVEPVWAMYGK